MPFLIVSVWRRSSFLPGLQKLNPTPFPIVGDFAKCDSRSLIISSENSSSVPANPCRRLSNRRRNPRASNATVTPLSRTILTLTPAAFSTSLPPPSNITPTITAGVYSARSFRSPDYQLLKGASEVGDAGEGEGTAEGAGGDPAAECLIAQQLFVSLG